MSNNNIIISVKNITKTFNKSFFNNQVFSSPALNNISFEIKEGQTVGLVGASGSGKSTLGKIIIKLILPTAGHVIYRNKDIFSISKKQFKPFRTELQMVFQNPYLSFNNLLTIEQILIGSLNNKHYNKGEKGEILNYLINLVGLNSKIKNKHPLELSGGECQRVSIARSLAVNPKFIVFDEATSALDVIVQYQITKTIKEIQEKLGLTYMFISHDIWLVKEVSDVILVMKDGEIIESGPANEIYHFPKHPYTKQLVQSFKDLNSI